MLNTTKLLSAVALVFLTSACASQKPVLIEQLASANDREVLVREFKRLADECWQRDPAFFRSGLRVKSYQSVQNSAVFTVAQWNRGEGSFPPFFSVEISTGDDGKPVIDVRATQDTRTLQYHDDTRRWAAGDYTCNQEKDT